MGLLDWFRRPRAPTPPTPPDEWIARGKLEAEVGALRLEWTLYKDQLNKLAQRLEKRDQRAAQRAEAEQEEAEERPQVSNQEHFEGFDPLEAQRQLRVRKNGLLHGSGPR